MVYFPAWRQCAEFHSLLYDQFNLCPRSLARNLIHYAHPKVNVYTAIVKHIGDFHMRPPLGFHCHARIGDHEARLQFRLPQDNLKLLEDRNLHQWGGEVDSGHLPCPAINSGEGEKFFAPAGYGFNSREWQAAGTGLLRDCHEVS